MGERIGEGCSGLGEMTLGTMPNRMYINTEATRERISGACGEKEETIE